MDNRQFRPYSKSELLDIEKDIYARHRLGDVVATHVPCLHEYKVKKGGRKEQHIIQRNASDAKNIMDDQTCSICFKIRTSPEDNTEIPELPHSDEPLSIHKLQNIDTFYRWLYRHDF